MVRAILEGRKTQTRRALKNQSDGNVVIASHFWEFAQFMLSCPFGLIGNTLWVRETWRPKQHNFPTGWPYEWKATAEEDGVPTEGPWKPSIFMPKEACRIRLRIVEVRAERLQDISEKDAEEEGVEGTSLDGGQTVIYKPSFADLWDKINGPGSWDNNPWVWVITFKRIQP